MKKVSLYTLIGLFALCSCACGGKDPVPTDPDPKPDPPVEVYDATLWTTTFDKTRDFEKSEPPMQTRISEEPAPAVGLNSSVRSFVRSSWLIFRRL